VGSTHKQLSGVVTVGQKTTIDQACYPETTLSVITRARKSLCLKKFLGF